MLGVDAVTLADNLRGIIVQRLIRKICDECRTGIEVDDALASLFEKYGIREGAAFKGNGCEKCSSQGGRGRIGVFEILQISHRLRELIMNNASPADLRKEAQQEGFKPLIYDGLVKAAGGIISYEEAKKLI